MGAPLRSLPETVAGYCLGGTTDFVVHVVCRDTAHLRRLTILSFTSRPEVSRIETSLVFSCTRREGHIRQRGVEALKTTHRPSPGSCRAPDGRATWAATGRPALRRTDRRLIA
ncbi:Lrp/AsnC ligand binding domain-containing protein [Myxococcus fulvus]|uniref:Lrp/AsnC ligand binding domain-containing protein n=1 Tax=Myxococcus fulvus TaxID=33 RepID=UPI001FE94A90|nr:Lrp/AsnC ligand binding domain-containing protein [Myxococcus fulvus]